MKTILKNNVYGGAESVNEASMPERVSPPKYINGELSPVIAVYRYKFPTQSLDAGISNQNHYDFKALYEEIQKDFSNNKLYFTIDMVQVGYHNINLEDGKKQLELRVLVLRN